MDKDIVPELLEDIKKEFNNQLYKSKRIKHALKILKNKKASYKNANDFAVEVGEILSNVLNKKITSEILPDGRMYFNIADRILNETLKNNYDLISEYSSEVQQELNSLVGVKIKSQIPDLNQDKIDGIINRIASELNFEDIKWILAEPIITFSQSIVDDTIEKNVEFHAKTGMRPKVTRTAVGKACEWCKEVAGEYQYPNIPKDVYRRHDKCRCTTEYNPGNGRKQNIWSKTWNDPDKAKKIAERKKIGISQR